MIFTQTGHVGSGFHALGEASMPTYLLTGGEPVLFDAGLTCLGPVFEKAVRETLGPDSPGILFLTHLHFDHCGAAAHLQEAFPGLRIASSARGAAIIQRPGAVRLIKKLNREATEMIRGWGVEGTGDEPFRPFEVDLVLEDGQVVDIGGGLRVRAISTPGHTRDFMSYYIPEKKILVGSEAVGCAAMNGYVVSDCLVDYDGFTASLKKLSRLEVEILAQGHHFVYTGEDVPAFFERSIRSAERFREMVLEFWEDEGDLGRIMSRIKAVEYDPQPPPVQLEQAYLINLEARIKAAGKGLIEFGD